MKSAWSKEFARIGSKSFEWAGDAVIEGLEEVGVGMGDGDSFADDGAGTTNTPVQIDGSVVTAGIKYVTGDITLALGTTHGEAKDSTTLGTAGTTDDSNDSTSASVTYAVASGVSAVVGYTTVDTNNEGASTTDGGSAWYIGASMSF